VVGILSMLPDPELNLDVVSYLVNDALIEIGAFHAKSEPTSRMIPGNRPLVPWRITGVHLIDAVTKWKTATTAPRLRGAAEAGKFADKALELRGSRSSKTGASKPWPTSAVLTTGSATTKPKLTQ